MSVCFPWVVSRIGKRAFHLLVAVLLLITWGVLKLGWEDQIESQQRQLRYHGIAFTKSLREELGQGAMVAVLAGMRAVVANYWWIKLEEAWENREWFRVKTLIELVTTLQPRSTLFWEMGGWHLAWNASTDARNNLSEPSVARRIRDERYWIEQGRQLLERGTQNIPERYNLWFHLGWIYEQKIKNYIKAAECYQEALKRPEAPIYLERFVGYDFERGGDYVRAYEWWKQLWLASPDHKDKRHDPETIERHLRSLEEKLALPQEKRVFAKP